MTNFVTTVFLASYVALFSTLASAESQLISLRGMLDYFSKGDSTENYDKLLSQKEQLSQDIDGRIGRGLQLNSDVEVFENENIYSVGVSETYKLGFDSDLTKKRVRLERDIDSQSSKISINEQKLEVAILFSKLMRHKELWDAKRDILLELEPLLKQADAAKNNGGAEALAVLKWKIMLDNQRAEKDILQYEFDSIVKSFNRLFGAKLPSDIAIAKFDKIALGVESQKSDGNKEQPGVNVLKKKLEALKVKAEELEYFEVEASLGYQSKTESESQAYIFGLSIPIGEHASKAKEIRRIRTESSLLESDVSREERLSKMKRENYLSSITGLSKRCSIQEGLVKSTALIFSDAKKGFLRGITEFSALIEAISAYDASRMSLVDSKEAHRMTVLNYKSYMGEL